MYSSEPTGCFTSQLLFDFPLPHHLNEADSHGAGSGQLFLPELLLLLLEVSLICGT